MKIKKIFFLAVIISSCSSVLIAEDFVTRTASELKSALKKVQPGDAVILTEGEWKDVSILFEARGTKEKPITLKAEIPGKVILCGSSSLKISGEYLIVDGFLFTNGFLKGESVIQFRKDEKNESSNCRLTNCAIIDYNPPDKWTEYKWVSIYGKNNRVDHCYFRNKVNAGCLLVVWLSNEANYHMIDSNYFAYRPELGENGAEIIRVGTSDWSMYHSYTTVQFNYFEQCNGEREIISNKSFYNKYLHNTFVECRGSLTLRHGNYCTVEGNYFFGNNVKGTGGIRIIGEGHKVFNNYIADTEGNDAFSAISFMNGVKNSPLNRYFQVKNAIVAFNTLVNNRTSIEIGVGKNDELSLPPTDCIIANNIIVSKKGKLITETDKPQNFKWEGNIFYGSESGINVADGISMIDPLLEKGIDRLYRPSFASPALKFSAGNYEEVNLDIDGQIRSGKKDVGCDQVSESGVRYKPVNEKNTGPEWLKTVQK